MARDPRARALTARRVGLILRVRGVVQGVGFRPFVYRLARRHALEGTVSNTADGVLIRVSGDPSAIERFRRELGTEAPPLARIIDVDIESVPAEEREDFVIEESVEGGSPTTLIPPDIATCERCVQEILDPESRRHGYAFTNCTDCGPRYTIIQGLPYDRPSTTMASFKMCFRCRVEYESPSDRRFHAQPNACPACGPRLTLLDGDGRALESSEPLAEAARQIDAGAIVAVKGIGGYHLAVDATSECAVERLRERKRRREKPLAILVSDLEAARSLCRVSEEEARLLEGARKPIVLLDRRGRDRSKIAPSVAPGQTRLGVFLPYAPLHVLLLNRLDTDAIVLTSGNRSEEPIAWRDSDAIERLSGIADVFLTHEREIFRHCDDSVAEVVGSGPRLLRRARGYAPEPVLTRHPRAAVLAVGGQLKNTICLTRGKEAFLSPHIGDLDNLETLEAFRATLEHLKSALEVSPVAVAHDLHPDYLSTRWALEESGLPAIPVQHHHAHIAAVLAEHDESGPVVGIVLDGTGYGTDGQIWGGEILVAGLESFSRQAHLPYVPLLGGEAAVREPWRMAFAWLYHLYGPDLFSLELPVIDRFARQGRVLLRALETGMAWPWTSSCGRLFDAVAALCGLRDDASYEAQAAMELEALAGSVECGDDTGHDSSVEIIVRRVVDELLGNEPAALVAARFHQRLSRYLVATAARVAREHAIGTVALGGGCFQNRILFEGVVRRIGRLDLRVLASSSVPPNDGGLALGQAAVAASRLAT